MEVVLAADETARVRERVWAAERHLRLLHKQRQQRQQQQQQQDSQQVEESEEHREPERQSSHAENLLLSPAFSVYLRQLLPVLPPAHPLFTSGPLLVEVVRCDIDSLRRSFFRLGTAAEAAADDAAGAADSTADVAAGSAVDAAGSGTAYPAAAAAALAAAAASSPAAQRLNVLTSRLFSCFPFCGSNDAPPSSSAETAAAVRSEICCCYRCSTNCCCCSRSLSHMKNDTSYSSTQRAARPLGTSSCDDDCDKPGCSRDKKDSNRSNSSAYGSCFCCSTSSLRVSSQLSKGSNFSFVDVCCGLMAALDLAAVRASAAAVRPTTAATGFLPPSPDAAAPAAGSWGPPMLRPAVSLPLAVELVRAAAALLAALLSAAAASPPAAVVSAGAPAEAAVQRCSSTSSEEKNSSRGEEGGREWVESSNEAGHPARKATENGRTHFKEGGSKKKKSNKEEGSGSASKHSSTGITRSESSRTGTSLSDALVGQQPPLLPSVCAAAWVAVLRLCEVCCRVFVAAVEAEVSLLCRSSRSYRRKGTIQPLLIASFCEPPARAASARNVQRQRRQGSCVPGEPQQQQGTEGGLPGSAGAAAEDAGVSAPPEEAALRQPLLWSLLYMAGCAHAARWIYDWGDRQQQERYTQQQQRRQISEGLCIQQQQQCERQIFPAEAVRPGCRSAGVLEEEKEEEEHEENGAMWTACLRLRAAAASAVASLFAVDDPRQQTLHFEELLESPRRLVRQQLQQLRQKLEQQQQSDGSAAVWTIQQQQNDAGGTACWASLQNQQPEAVEDVHVELQQQQQPTGRRGAAKLVKESGKQQQRQQQQQGKSAAALVLECLLTVLNHQEKESRGGGHGAAVEMPVLLWRRKCSSVVWGCVRCLFFCAATRQTLPQLGLLQLLPTLTGQLASYLRTFSALSGITGVAVATPTAGDAASDTATPAADRSSSSGKPEKRPPATAETCAAAAAGPHTSFRAVLVLLQVLLQHEQQQQRLAFFPLKVAVEEKQQLVGERTVTHRLRQGSPRRQQQAQEEAAEQAQGCLLQPGIPEQLCMLLQYFMHDEAQSTSLVQQWQVVCSPGVALLQQRDDPHHVQRDALLCFGTQVMLRLGRLFGAASSVLLGIQMAIHSIKRSIFTSSAIRSYWPAGADAAARGAAAAAATARSAAEVAPHSGTTETEEASGIAARRQRAATAASIAGAAAEALTSSSVAATACTSLSRPTPDQIPAACSGKCSCRGSVHVPRSLPAASACCRPAATETLEQQRDLQQVLGLVLLLRSTLARQAEELWGGLRLVVQHLPAAFEDTLLTHSFSLVQEEQRLWLLLQEQQQQLLALLCARRHLTALHNSQSAMPHYHVSHSASCCICVESEISASSSPVSCASFSFSSSVSPPSLSASSFSPHSASQSSCSSVTHGSCPEGRDAAAPRLLYLTYMENFFKKQQKTWLLSRLPFVQQQQQIFPGATHASNQPGSGFFAYLFVAYRGLHDLSALLSSLSTWQQIQQQPSEPAQQQGQQPQEEMQRRHLPREELSDLKQQKTSEACTMTKEEECLTSPRADERASGKGRISDEGHGGKNKRRRRESASSGGCDGDSGSSSGERKRLLRVRTTVRSVSFLLSPAILQHFGAVPVTALPAQLPALADFLLRLLLEAGDALSAALLPRQQPQASVRGEARSSSRREWKAAQTEACVAGASGCTQRQAGELLSPTATRESAAADACSPTPLATEEEAAANATAAHRFHCSTSSEHTPACSREATGGFGTASRRSGDHEGSEKTEGYAPRPREGRSRSKMMNRDACLEDADARSSCGEVSAGAQFSQCEGETATAAEEQRSSRSAEEQQGGASVVSFKWIPENDGESQKREGHCSYPLFRNQETADLFAAIENVAVYRLVLSYFAAGILELQHPTRRSQQLQQQLEALLPRLLSFWVAAAAALLQQRQLFISLGLDQILDSPPQVKPRVLTHPCGCLGKPDPCAQSVTAATGVSELRGGTTAVTAATGVGRQHERQRLRHLWQHSEACLSVSLASLLLVFRAWEIPSYSTSKGSSGACHSREQTTAAARASDVQVDPVGRSLSVAALQQRVLQLLQQLALELMPGHTVCSLCSRGAARGAGSEAGARRGSKKGADVDANSNDSSDSSRQTDAWKDERNESDSVRSSESYLQHTKVCRRSRSVERGTGEAGVLLGVRAGLLFLLLSEGTEWGEQQERQQRQRSDRLPHSRHVSTAEQIAFAAIDCLNSVARGELTTPLCGVSCSCGGYRTSGSVVDGSCSSVENNSSAVAEGEAGNSSNCLCDSETAQCAYKQVEESCGLSSADNTEEVGRGLQQQIGWLLWNAEVLPYIPLLIRHLSVPSAGAGGADGLNNGLHVSLAAAAVQPELSAGEEADTTRDNTYCCTHTEWRWRDAMATLASWVVPDGRRAPSTAADEQQQRQQKQLLQQAGVFEIHCLQPFVLMRVEALLRDARLRLAGPQLQQRQDMTWKQQKIQQHRCAPVPVDEETERQHETGTKDANAETAAALKAVDHSDKKAIPMHVEQSSGETAAAAGDAAGAAAKSDENADAATAVSAGAVFKQVRVLLRFLCTQLSQGYLSLEYRCSTMDAAAVAATAPAVTPVYICEGSVEALDGGERKNAAAEKRSKRKRVKTSKPDALLMQLSRGEERYIPQRRLLQEIWRCLEAILAWLMKMQILLGRAVLRFNECGDGGAATGETQAVKKAAWIYGRATDLRAAAATDAAAVVVEALQAVSLLGASSAAAREALLKILQEKQQQEVYEEVVPQQQETQQQEQQPLQECRGQQRQRQKQPQPQQQVSLQEGQIVNTRKKEKRKRSERISHQPDAAASNEQRYSDVGREEGTQYVPVPLSAPQLLKQLQQLNACPFTTLSHTLITAQQLADVLWIAATGAAPSTLQASAATAPSLADEAAAPTAPAKSVAAGADAGTGTAEKKGLHLPGEPELATGEGADEQVEGRERVRCLTKPPVYCHLSNRPADAITRLVLNLVCQTVSVYPFDEARCQTVCGKGVKSRALATAADSPATDPRGVSAASADGRAPEITAPDTAAAEGSAADAAVAHGEAAEAEAVDLLPGLWCFMKTVRVALEQALLRRREGKEGRAPVAPLHISPRDAVWMQLRATEVRAAASGRAGERCAHLRLTVTASASAASLQHSHENRWQVVSNAETWPSRRVFGGVTESNREEDSVSRARGRQLRQILCVLSCLTRLIQHIVAWKSWEEWVQQQGARQRKSSSRSLDAPDAAAWKEWGSTPAVTGRAGGSSAGTDEKVGSERFAGDRGARATSATSAARAEPPQVLLTTVAAVAASLQAQLPLPVLLQFLLHCMLTERFAQNAWRERVQPQQRTEEEKGVRQRQLRRQLQKHEGTQQKKEAREQEDEKGQRQGEQQHEDDSTDVWGRRIGSFYRRELVLLATLVARHALTLELWLADSSCSNSLTKVQQMPNSRRQSQQQKSRLQEQHQSQQQHMRPSEKIRELRGVKGETYAEPSVCAGAAKNPAGSSLPGGVTAAANCTLDGVGAEAMIFQPFPSVSTGLECTGETVLSLLETLLAELWTHKVWASRPLGYSCAIHRCFPNATRPRTTTCTDGSGDEAAAAFSETYSHFAGAEEAAKIGTASCVVPDVVLDAVQDVLRCCCSQWAAAVSRYRRQLREKDRLEQRGHFEQQMELRQHEKEPEQCQQEQVEQDSHQRLQQQQDEQQDQHRNQPQQQQEPSGRHTCATVGRRLVAMLVKIGEVKILQALNRGSNAKKPRCSILQKKRAGCSGRRKPEDAYGTILGSGEVPPGTQRSRVASSVETHVVEGFDYGGAICEATVAEQLLLQLPSAADVCEDRGARQANALSLAAASTTGEWAELLTQQLPAGLLLELVSGLSSCLSPIEQQTTVFDCCSTSCITSLAVGQALLLLLQQRTTVMGCLRSIVKVRAGAATTLQQQLLQSLCSLLQRLQHHCRDAWALLSLRIDRSVDTAPYEVVSRAKQQLLCAWLSVCVARVGCVLGGIVKLLATEGQKKARQEQGRLAAERSRGPGIQVVAVGRGALEVVALVLARGAQLAMETLYRAPRDTSAGWLSSARWQCANLEHLHCQAATQLHVLLLLLPLNPQLQQLYLPLITDLFVRLLYVVLQPGVVSSRRRYAVLLRKSVEEFSAWRSSATTFSSVKRSCERLLLLLAAEVVDVLRRLRLLSVSTTAPYLDDGESVLRHGAFAQRSSASQTLGAQAGRKNVSPTWGADDEWSEGYHTVRRKEKDNAAAAAELVKALLPILKSAFEGAGIKDVDDEALAQVCANLRQPLVRAELIGAVKLFEKFDKFKGKV